VKLFSAKTVGMKRFASPFAALKNPRTPHILTLPALAATREETSEVFWTERRIYLREKIAAARNSARTLLFSPFAAPLGDTSVCVSASVSTSVALYLMGGIISVSANAGGVAYCQREGCASESFSSLSSPPVYVCRG